LNGAAVRTVSYSGTLALINRFFQGVGGTKYACVRAYSRQLSEGEVLSEYNTLSRYNAQETAYVFALADGKDCAGQCVQDLSSGKVDVGFVNAAQTAIGSPGQRGKVRYTTVGSVVFTGAPVGARIISWVADVSVAGGGSVISAIRMATAGFSTRSCQSASTI